MGLTEVLKTAGVTYEEALELHKVLIAGTDETVAALKQLRRLTSGRITQGTETFYSLQNIRWELHESLMDDNDSIEAVFRHAFPWIVKAEESLSK